MLLVFSFIFTVASRLLHLCSTDDKNILVKDEEFLYIEGHPEWSTELHGKEKRKRVVRGDCNEMRRNEKR